MSKIPQRKTPSSSPRADQLAAVRRLAESGDIAQAHQRLATLRKSFPDFKPLLGLAWEVEDLCGEPIIAAARAYEWQSLSPHSRAAVEALCTSAYAADLAAVYARAVQRLSVMDGQGEVALPETVDSTLGALSLEQAETIDLSRMHVANGNPAAAVAVLQGVDHPSARNNLALALFLCGDLTQARAVIEANWQAEPDNLFALESLLRWRCWVEGLACCQGFGATLLHTQPRRVEDAIARVAALRFLDDETAARQAWQESKKAPYWRDASDEQREVFANLKDVEAALPGSVNMWFPGPWLRAVTALAAKPKGQTESQWEQGWHALLDTCEAHADYLSRAVELGETGVRILALAVLKHRAERADGAAIAGLQALLKRPYGPDSTRTELLNWLIEQGLHNRQELAEIWLKGELRTTRLYGLRITDEPRDSPFPPEGTALNFRIIDAIHHRKLPQALALAQQLHQMYPDQPMALVNLASIKEGLRHPDAEITALFRQAHALAPDYLFARCGLARCLANQGHIEEAQKLLEGLLEREEFHRSEYRTFLEAQRALALASGDKEAARFLRQTLADLDNMLDNG